MNIQSQVIGCMTITSLERLQQIPKLKELEFPLKEIKKYIDAPLTLTGNKALEQQIELLTMKKVS